MTKNLQPKLRTTVALITLLSILAYAPGSKACGPFTLDAIFTFSVHPEFPLAKFARGQLGVIPPTYARSYLFVAYRRLNGASFTPAQEKALVDLWTDRLDLGPAIEEENLTEPWVSARSKIAGISAAPKIEVYRNREKPNEYESYLNCQADAFKNAANTLSDRVAKFGAKNASIKDWIAAQDEVFANCQEGKHIPAATASNADSLIKSDRVYQTAAANFYAGDFAESEKLYREIANDETSPWRQAAHYLLARSLVREASLGVPENKVGPLTAAEKELRSILKDRSLSQWHPAASRLGNLVRLRLHPEERLHELAQLLLTPKGDDLKQDLWDYTFLLDQFVDDDSNEPKNDAPATLRDDELTDWLITFQSSKSDSLDHSLAKFDQTATLPWLIAALTKIDSRHPRAKQLLSAAAAVPTDSPAYATVSYHQIRLALEAKRFEVARTKLDQLLQNRARLNVSSLNLVLSQRMLLATDLNDFLTYAQRVPAAFSYDDDGREIPEVESDLTKEAKEVRGKPLFDADVAKLLNERFPLPLWQQAAESKVLSPNLHRDVAQAAWLRAVILGDMKTADELAPTLKAAVPQLSGLLDEFVAASSLETKKFIAIYAWLKFPGLEPVVDAGIGRTVPLDQQDEYRDNWWCTAAFADSQTAAVAPDASPTTLLKSIPADSVPLFLTTSERALARQQLTSIKALGAGPTYLSRQAIQWANAEPDNPRVPEALHLAVKSTRYGCTDKNSARWSKAAFDLLHKRFPKSVWAKRTPYWFKG